jgi:hypothetical protein
VAECLLALKTSLKYLCNLPAHLLLVQDLCGFETVTNPECTQTVAVKKAIIHRKVFHDTNIMTRVLVPSGLSHV